MTWSVTFLRAASEMLSWRVSCILLHSKLCSVHFSSMNCPLSGLVGDHRRRPPYRFYRGSLATHSAQSCALEWKIESGRIFALPPQKRQQCRRRQTSARSFSAAVRLLFAPSRHSRLIYSVVGKQSILVYTSIIEHMDQSVEPAPRRSARASSSAAWSSRPGETTGTDNRPRAAPAGTALVPPPSSPL